MALACSADSFFLTLAAFLPNDARGPCPAPQGKQHRLQRSLRLFCVGRGLQMYAGEFGLLDANGDGAIDAREYAMQVSEVGGAGGADASFYVSPFIPSTSLPTLLSLPYALAVPPQRRLLRAPSRRES